jgi:hypothetical protein
MMISLVVTWLQMATMSLLLPIMVLMGVSGYAVAQKTWFWAAVAVVCVTVSLFLSIGICTTFYDSGAWK